MSLIKKTLLRLIFSSSLLTIIYQFFFRAPASIFNIFNFYKSDKRILQEFYLNHKIHTDNNIKSLDLGCGPNPSNPFLSDSLSGLDLYEDLNRSIYKCNLGFDRIPFEDNSFEYITAFDLIEHIPRHSYDGNKHLTPFIFLMNEIHRVLKKDGVFLSFTPVYPFLGSFQDPTHNNIITFDTYEYYFSENKHTIASHYGIETNFKIRSQKLFREHLISVLQKK